MGLTASKFIFILSPERSGSTLLSAILGGSPRVIAPAELHLMRYSTVGEWRNDYPKATASLRSLLNRIGKEKIKYSDQTKTATLYEMISSRATEDSIIVDKTPAYSRDKETLVYIETLRPRYIWLVRHPIGVASSIVELTKRNRRLNNTQFRWRIKYPLYLLREIYYQKTGYWIKKYASEWMKVNKNIEEFLLQVDGSRWIRINFEELLAEPEETVKTICVFLGIDFVPGMLLPQKSAPKELSWGIGDEKLLEYNGINPGRAYSWKRHYKEKLVNREILDYARSIGVRTGV